jgi:hypothetical protein
MAWGDKTYEKFVDAVRQRTGEDVVRVGWASRPGATAAVVQGELVGGAASLAGGLGPLGVSIPRGRIHREGGKDTKLPVSFLVAVTREHVYVYKFTKGWFGVKLKQELGAFDRDGLQVGVHAGKVMRQFTLVSPAAGQSMAFEMMRHRVTDELEAALR